MGLSLLTRVADDVAFVITPGIGFRVVIRRAVPAIGYQRVPSDAAAICDELRVAWVERAARPGRGEPAASLGGRRVLTLESRRSPELALLVMNCHTVVASIGPMTSEELRLQALSVDFEPSHPKIGFLVKELAEQCEALLHNKRCLESTTRDGCRE